MMKENKKNYIILILLIVFTIVITIVLSNLYKNLTKTTSEFYNISNHIKIKEYDNYLIENPDVILYLFNKYDLTYSNFENQLLEKLELLNLKEKFLYIDLSSEKKKNIVSLEKKYNIELLKTTSPTILIISDGKLIKVYNEILTTDSVNYIHMEELK